MTKATSSSVRTSKDVANRFGVSVEAVELVREVDVIDLHIEPYLPHRLYGYDLHQRHGKGLLRGHLMGHLDFPRMEEGELKGAMWSITTNVARGVKGRWGAFQDNMRRIQSLMKKTEGRFQIVCTAGEYRRARADGAHAAMVVVQGGNALEGAPDGLQSVPDELVRVTLVHLTNSVYGVTSSPLRMGRGSEGLTSAGKDLVEQLNHRRVFVDLAHINPAGFWDAVERHDKSQPLLVTHTGVNGVLPHWRNLDDDQLKAVADTGGTVGVIFARQFLERRGGPQTGEMVMEHLEHIIATVGEDHVSLGSDLDGFITPPPDLRSGDAYFQLVQRMLDRAWSSGRIEKVLSGNFLRTFEQLRP